jgi:hypothetical protein
MARIGIENAKPLKPARSLALGGICGSGQGWLEDGKCSQGQNRDFPTCSTAQWAHPGAYGPSRITTTRWRVLHGLHNSHRSFGLQWQRLPESESRWNLDGPLSACNQGPQNSERSGECCGCVGHIQIPWDAVGGAFARFKDNAPGS